MPNAHASRRAIRFAGLSLDLAAAATLALTFATSAARAEDAAPAAKASGYFSQADDRLTIRKVAILPTQDNVDGIYARPIEAQLISLAKADRRWDFVESSVATPTFTIADLEENPQAFKSLVAGVDADAFVAASVAKGPNGLSIKLDLFLKNDGRMIAQESVKDRGRFDLPDVKEQASALYRKAFAALPYDGLVLSRQQNRVTVNLGRADGLAPNQTLSVVQILKIARHPKFDFIVSAEKEIIGKIRILKVDEGLSFGAIISEREKGAVHRFAKIAGLDPVTYPETSDLSAAAGAAGPQERGDADVSFGKGAKEWLPVRPPAFGQVGFKLGLGQYNGSVNLSGVGSLEEKSSVYPQIGLYGELWLSPNWQVRADILQGVITTDNPRGGSELNHSMSRYQMTAGYNFLLRDDFFGPKFQINLGYMTYRMYVDDSRPPTMMTTTYSGFVVGVGGSLPITERKDWFLGGSTNLILFPSMSETPATSGSSSTASINDFSLYVERKMGENIRGVVSLDFSLYSANFSGQGSRVNASGAPESATTASQRLTSLNAGISYLF